MAGLSNALSKRIPLCWDPLGSLPKGLFWKEMRQLQSVFWGFLALQVIGYLCLLGPFGYTRDASEGAGVKFISIHLFLGGAMTVLALLGAMFFALENEERTGPFLLRMPVSRRAVFWNKIAAAAATWTALVFVSALLFWMVKGLWPALAPTYRITSVSLQLRYPPGGVHGWTWYVSAGMFAFLAGAIFSLRMGSVLYAFFAGIGLTAALQAPSHALVMLLDHPGSLALISSSVSLASCGASVNFLCCVVAGRMLWKRFNKMEESLSVEGRSADSVWSGFSRLNRPAATLFAVELRTKRFLCIALVVAPTLLVACRAGLLVLWWLPLAGLLSGVTMWSRQECDGANFFLHLVPISRRRLFVQRLLSGLAFNVVCLAFVLLPFWFFEIERRHAGRDTSTFLNILGNLESFGRVRSADWRLIRRLDPFSSAGVWGSEVRRYYLWTVFFGLPFTQFAGFFVGAIVSPLRRGNVIGVILATVITALLAGPTILMWAFDPIGLLWAAAMILGGLFALAWWTDVRSRAMEPAVRKGWRVLGLGAAAFVWAALINLIDPLDALYLIGIDVYGWF